MDVSRVLSMSGILALYLGVSGLLGAVFNRSYRVGQARWRWAARGLAAAVAVPLALTLPFPPAARCLAWSLGLLALWLYGLRPAWLPAPFTGRAFAQWYLGGLLVLIFAWSAATGRPLNLLEIGLPALAAAGVVIGRVLRLGALLRKALLVAKA